MNTIKQKEFIKIFEKNGFEHFNTTGSGDFNGFEITTYHTEYKADENYIVLVKKEWQNGPNYYLKAIVKNKLIYYTSDLETANTIKHCIKRAIAIFYDQLNTIYEREGKEKKWILAK